MKPSFILSTLLLSSTAIFAAETKRIIVCTVTTGFRHSSIAEAEKTLQQLADESKAFTIVDWVRQPKVEIPKKPSKPKEPKADADQKAKDRYAADLKRYEEEAAKWTGEMEAKAKAAQADADAQLKAAMAKLAPDALRAAKIDGVIFANTTGDNYPLPDSEGFTKWVAEGHAWMGMHSATDTFKTFAPYYDMIQGSFNGHGAQVPAALVNADKSHPANNTLPDQWNLSQEEMYLIKNHDRSKVRSLLHMRNHPNKTEETGYFPVAWCRDHGKGRVFYTSLGHREDLWSNDPALKDRKNSIEISNQYRAHILGGIKWALGLAKGDATPNPDVK